MNIYYLIILLVLLSFLLLASRLSIGSNKEFFVLTKSQRTITLSMSFFASGMGIWILTSPAEVGWYGLGPDVYGYAISAATPFIILYFLGPKIASIIPDGTTLAEFIFIKYGRSAQILTSVVAIIYMSAFLVAEFASIGLFVETLFSISGLSVSILVGLTTLIYLFRSGFKASLRTDIFQGVAIIIILLLLIVFWLIDSGPQELMKLAIDGGMTSSSSFSIKSALAVVLAVTAAEIFSQGYWQRTFSAEKETSLKGACVFAGAGCFVTVLILGFAGTVGAGMGIENPSLSFIGQLEGNSFISYALLVLGICLVTSSVDTLENAIAATISTDILQNSKLQVSRIVTVAIVVSSIFLSLQVTNIFSVFLVADLLATALVVPALIYLNKKSSSIALIAPFVFGVLGALVYRFFFIDLETNPGGLFVPTDLYGLADLNTFLVALVISSTISFLANRKSPSK